MTAPRRAPLHVAALYGGRSGEHEVSLISARAVMAALTEAGFQVVPIALDKSGRFLLQHDTSGLAARPAHLDPRGTPLALDLGAEGGAVLRRHDDGRPVAVDVVFPVLHGTYGEDGTIQGLFEMARLPYVGSGVLGSSVGMDKDVTKRLLASAGIDVVPWCTAHVPPGGPDDALVAALRADIDRRLGAWPVFVKPANMGSSVGISKVREPAQLAAAVAAAAAYDTKVVVERGVDAREIEVSVLGNDAPEVSVAGEIVPRHEYYSYAAKYLDDHGADLLLPAPLTNEQAARVRDMAARAFRALDLAGLARVDFFLSRTDDRLYLNEANTMPGFTQISMYPKLWAASGLPFPRLVTRLVELALERHARRDALRTSFDPAAAT